MTPEDVTEIIQRELAGQETALNPLGLDVEACLVLPRKAVYEDSFLDGRTLDLWLVLVADSGHGTVHHIVFDEATRQFGMATKGPGGAVFLGHAGTFLEALDGL